MHHKFWTTFCEVTRKSWRKFLSFLLRKVSSSAGEGGGYFNIVENIRPESPTLNYLVPYTLRGTLLALTPIALNGPRLVWGLHRSSDATENIVLEDLEWENGMSAHFLIEIKLQDRKGEQQ